mgnify:CR=1 FL=1
MTQKVTNIAVRKGEKDIPSENEAGAKKESSKNLDKSYEKSSEKTFEKRADNTGNGNGNTSLSNGSSRKNSTPTNRNANSNFNTGILFPDFLNEPQAPPHIAEKKLENSSYYNKPSPSNTMSRMNNINSQQRQMENEMKTISRSLSEQSKEV